MALRRQIFLAVTLIALGTTLSACEDFDPDKWDFLGLNKKKPLPGERKELFPSGVPGVTQGIPPEYMKGYQPQPDSAPTADLSKDQQAKQAAAEEEPKAEPKSKPKAKPKPKPRVVKQTPAPAAPPPSAQPQPAPAWPNQPPQQSQQTDSAWPQPPSPGTFSR